MTLATFISADTRHRYMTLYDGLLKNWPVPYVERYVSTSYGKTHVLVSGPEGAPPLVLLHGFMATNLMWETQIAELSRHYRCYSVQVVTDVGKSEQTAPVRGVADYVSWLKEVFAGLGLAKARLMGLSYGGFVATGLAVHAPELVEKAVLLCPAGTLSPLTPQFILRALPGMITKSSALLRWYWAWFFHDKRHLNHFYTDLFVAAWQTFQQSREFVQPSVYTDEELRRISCPTTVLIGEHEVIYKNGPRVALQRAQAIIPGARTHLISNAAHVLTLDNPEETNRLVLEALA